MANTVSPHYCKEITQPEDQDRYFEGGKRLDKIALKRYKAGKLIGILNGFEYKIDPVDKNFKAILKQKADMKKALATDFGNP